MLDPHLFIVFGATGDLMERKLLPALYDLYHHEEANGRYRILGVSRSDLSDDDFRTRAREALAEFLREDQTEADTSEEKIAQWCDEYIFFQSLGDQEQADYDRLAERIEKLEEEHGLPGNRVLYLALPPAAFEDTIKKLGGAGLNASEGGWARFVLEKPFGHDLESARELNELVHDYFAEDQIYRIDHYLGKETVQNLLVFRLGNAIFESLWSREHIERVEILVAESVGVGDRAGYYDRAGALRDMVQNHLTQLMTLVAMEVPATAEANAIRYEKIKVLQSVQPLTEGDVVLGQYTAADVGGEAVKGYREENGVGADSQTETFVSVRLSVNNWRWQGVPFVLQTGKRMPERCTRIAVTFRRPPVTLFRTYNGCRLAPNVLNITLQPDEGFSLSFEVKRPGDGYVVETEQLRFDYEEAFGALPDAYRTLLEDVVRGDQTLFVHAQEAEAAWELYTPLLERKPPVKPYEAGTWGPSEAEKLTEPEPALEEG